MGDNDDDWDGKPGLSCSVVLFAILAAIVLHFILFYAYCMTLWES